MMHKHLKNPDENPIVIDQKNRERRKVLQKQYEEDYQQALVDIKEKLVKYLIKHLKLYNKNNNKKYSIKINNFIIFYHIELEKLKDQT